MKPHILVVDDEASHRRMLELVLTREGYAVDMAADGLEAVAAVEKQFYDLILLDIRMAGLGGIDALHKIRRLSAGIPVIMMTAYASVSTAIEALKSGAYDYLTKPLDIEELKILVAKALRHRQLEQENRCLKEQLDQQFSFDNIIGRSAPMQALFETLALVAPSEATVLISGESGTGKELIANAIHHNSPRREQPLVKVNCAALPETLLESELFGHARGAFTGAVAQRQGRFQLADRGSIFLDEIGEMAPTTQAKILRVLQEREFEPLGDTRTLQVDTRVITATNQNLDEAIRQGRFREDLYYRLNVVKIWVPPLRERKEDVPLLAEHFLKQYSEKNRRLLKGFNPRAMDLLMRYNWPGNIRELENVVERSVIMARGEVITVEEFPGIIREADPAYGEREIDMSPGKSLREMEKQMILRTLAETGGNRTHAAAILGISRRTLQLKLKEYGKIQSP